MELRCSKHRTKTRSHIAPVCTTELGLVAALQDEFDARDVKVIGLSANDLDSHDKWIADINEVNNVDLKFPIIADAKREVAALYDMLDYQVCSIGLEWWHIVLNEDVC